VLFGEIMTAEKAAIVLHLSETVGVLHASQRVKGEKSRFACYDIGIGHK
jgi:hypothetical protein